MTRNLQNACRSQTSSWGLGIRCFLLAFMLLPRTALWASPQGRPAKQKPTLAEQLVKIAPGSRVQVRLSNKEKILGRLDNVSATDFTLIVQTRNGVDKRRLRFDDVKSVRVIGGMKGFAVVLGVAGVVVAVILLLSV